MVSVFACIFLHDLHKLAGKATLTVENVDRAAIAAGAAAGNVEKASRAWQDASEAQTKLVAKTFINVNRAVVSANVFLRSTNKQLNSQLLPALSNAVNQQNEALLINQHRLGDDLSQISQATTSLQGTIADGQVILTDPAIKQSLENLALAAQNTAEGTKQLSLTAEDTRQVADKFRETYLKPQKFAWELLKSLVGMGGSFAQMIK